jgi:hypothetical protein
LSSYKLDRTPLALKLSFTLAFSQRGNDKFDVITHSKACGMRLSLPWKISFISRESTDSFKSFAIDRLQKKPTDIMTFID